MFGYVTINRCELKVKDLEKYEAYYCGLCKTLKDNYGLTGCSMLNYDMTFLAMLYSGLYEEDTVEGDHRCFMGLGKKKHTVQTEAMKYAADMNYLMAYHSHADNWLDEHRLSSLNAVHMMHRKYSRLAEKYPRQEKALREYVRLLHVCEARGDENIETAANLTGKAMAEIYDWKEDIWSEGLRQMGYYMGKFIYLMDAYDDIEKDIKSGNYNPFRNICCEDGFESRCREYFGIIMGRCCRAFETLPIIENGEILRNILYAGVWTKYADITMKRQNKAESKEK